MVFRTISTHIHTKPHIISLLFYQIFSLPEWVVNNLNLAFSKHFTAFISVSSGDDCSSEIGTCKFLVMSMRRSVQRDPG